jgi:hypothetical protein
MAREKLQLQSFHNDGNKTFGYTTGNSFNNVTCSSVDRRVVD